LHRHLHQELNHAIEAKDQRHLARLAEMLYALLLSGSSVAGVLRWSLKRLVAWLKRQFNLE
jgi:hypothetical protein